MCLLTGPLAQLRFKRRELQEEVFRLPHHGPGARHAAARLQQVDCVEHLPAAVALVAPRFLVAAQRARAFNVTVGQEAAGLRVEQLVLGVLVKELLLQEPQEDVLRCLVVVLGQGRCVEVEADAQPLPHLQDLRVVAFDDDARLNALLVGGDGDGRAVTV